MKKYAFLLLFVLPSIFIMAQSRYDKEPYQTRSLSGDNIKNVEVETSGGSISVTGGTASEARIEVYVSPNNSNTDLSKEEIKQRLEEMYDLNISVSGNKLTAVAKPKQKIKDWKKALNISFKIFSPVNVSTNLATSGGSIHLTNLSGEQDFSTSGGSLHIEKLSGKIKGRTSGGSIHLEESKDDIDLRTSGGSIEAKNCKGKLTLSTSGGSLMLKGLDGVINANTSGGSITGKNIGGELVTHTSGGSIQLNELTCSVDASTSGGGIDISITQLGKYVKLNNSGGDIELELPKGKGLDLDLSGNRIKTAQLENFSGKIDDDEIDGKLNGGGVPVTVKAGSGRVHLALK